MNAFIYLFIFFHTVPTFDPVDDNIETASFGGSGSGGPDGGAGVDDEDNTVEGSGGDSSISPKGSYNTDQDPSIRRQPRPSSKAAAAQQQFSYSLLLALLVGWLMQQQQLHSSR